MAEIITHSFVSAKSQSPDTTLVSKNEWNDGHVFSGGLNGQVLIYDNTQPNNMRWTDGASSTIETVPIANGTTSPQANFLTLAFTTTSAALVNISVFFAATATGAADSVYTVSLDGTPIIGGFTSANGVATTQVRTVQVAAGAHLIDLDISTVGNVTWTSGTIQISATRFGI